MFFFSSRLELPIHFYCTTVLDEWSIIFVWMAIYVMGFPLLVLQTVSSFSISRCWLRRPILILFWRTKVENTHYSFHSGWFVFFLKFGRKKRSVLKRFAWRGFRSWSGGETRRAHVQKRLEIKNDRHHQVTHFSISIKNMVLQAGWGDTKKMVIDTECEVCVWVFSMNK